MNSLCENIYICIYESILWFKKKKIPYTLESILEQLYNLGVKDDNHPTNMCIRKIYQNYTDIYISV